MQHTTLKSKAGTAARTALFTLVAAIVAGPASLSAAEPGIDPALKFAMQRDLGIFEGQIPQYLKTERLAALNESLLERQLGPRYGGSWIERKPDGTFAYVVASTGIGKTTVPAGVELRLRRSTARRRSSTTSPCARPTPSARSTACMRGAWIRRPTASS
jgi:alpha-lytic endopeptidase